MWGVDTIYDRPPKREMLCKRRVCERSGVGTAARAGSAILVLLLLLLLRFCLGVVLALFFRGRGNLSREPLSSGGFL